MTADDSGLLRRAALFARTVRHLRPAQIAHRARLRTQRMAFNRFPDALGARVRRPLPRQPGWPAGFECLDARQALLAAGGGDVSLAEAAAKGQFRFLGDERSLGDPPDWEQGGADRLWRYHLHYFEWAWALAAHPDRAWARTVFGPLWRSWRNGTEFGRRDAWSPYVASLRAWVLCGLHPTLVAGQDFEDDYLDQVALHAGFARTNLELDVGGNHLLKNLKAVAGLGVFLADRTLVDVAAGHIARQLPIQVLRDGGHYERSPSYHCQVLGDLIDVAELLRSAGLALPAGLVEAVAAMRRWLGVMLMPDGDVPLFNDCTRVGHQRLALLQPARPRGPGERLTVLQPSGYVVARTGAGRFHLVADVGPPCPRDLPAHAHADCLSFELAVDGHRLVVDTGTSTYEAGDRRNHERSTAAHNTVTLDGEDQTEVWAAFRAARRAMPQLERATDDGAGDRVLVSASHDGYERLPGRPRHRRTWRMADTALEITDEVDGGGVHTSVGRLMLAPGTAVTPRGQGCYGVDGADICFAGGEPALEAREVAQSFDGVEPAPSLLVWRRGPLPHRLVTRIVIGRGPWT